MIRRVFLCTALIFMLVFCNACKKTDNRTVIKFSSWGSQSEIAVLKPLLEEFETQNPDLKIEFIHIPQGYFRKLHLLFASNLAPDVIFINNLYLPVYSDFLEDLTPYINNQNDFFEKAIKTLSINGKLYAVPRDVSNLVIYYNKDIFDNLKLEYPKSNWTFNDFLATSLKLSGKNHWAISFEENSLFYLPYLMSEGGGILSDDSKTIIIDTPQSKKGLTFYADLKNKYHVAPKRYESASSTMAQLFLEGKLAMHLSGRWLVPKYRESANFNWDIINFPNGNNGSIVPLDASGWAVVKSSEKKIEALKLINFLSSTKSIEKLTQTGLITPARKDIAYSNTFLSGKPKNAYIFLDVINTAHITPVSKEYREITDSVNKKLEILFKD